ncbi:MAG: hypothetical protein CM15mP49_05700 [Actinomycetota bacterium]|nr:MAG: hypothetical protein CM15mP49_05700 [Actinomycetota bacterium]
MDAYRKPDIQTHLADNPQKITTFVEEVLRLESPTQGMDRHTIEDVELNEITIPKGSHIHMRYAAANRDETNSNAQLTLI